MTNKVTVATTTALVPHNPQVQAISTSLRMRPERLIARIEKALPAPMEQQLYLQLGEGFRLMPESLGKLLREFLGERQLIAEDLVSRTIGENLVSNRFSEVSDFLQQVLNLVSKDVDIPISMRAAAKLVIAYGDGAESVVDDLIANSEYLAARFKLRSSRPGRVVSFGITFLIDTVLPKESAAGRPNPRTLSEYFERSGMTETLRHMTRDDEED